MPNTAHNSSARGQVRLISKDHPAARAKRRETTHCWLEHMLVHLQLHRDAAQGVGTAPLCNCEVQRECGVAVQ